MKKSKLSAIPTLNQFILTSLTVVMIVIILMTLVVTNILFKKSIESAKVVNTDNARQIADTLENDFNNMVRFLSLTRNAFSKLDFNSKGADEYVADMMTTLLDLTPVIHRAWFVFEKGVFYKDEYYIKEYVNIDGEVKENSVLSNLKRIGDPINVPWYIEPMNTGEVYVGLNNIDNLIIAGGVAYSTMISIPVFQDGKVVGVCCANVLYRDILSQLSNLHEKQNRVLFLLNQDKTILNTHHQRYTGKNLDDFGYKEINEISDVIKQRKIYSAEIMSPILHEKIFLFLQPISFRIGTQQQNLYIHIGTPIRILYANAYDILVLIVTTNLICMAFLFGMIFWSSYMVVKPIRILATKAQRVASGDFKYDIFEPSEDDLRGKSEVATLHRAFNEMLHALQDNLLTVEKRVEERTKELKKLNNYITLLMNSATSYSLLLDRDAKTVYYSESLKTLTGKDDIENYIGTPFLEVFKSLFKDERFINAVKQRVKRVMTGEDLVKDETVVWPDGTINIYRIRYKRIVDENNKLEGIIIAAQDITTLRYEETERRFNDMLHSTSVPAVAWDEKGNVIAFNEESINIFGFHEDVSLEEFKKSYLSIQPEYQPDGRLTQDLKRQDIEETLKNGFAQDTIFLSKPDGTSIYVRVILNRISGMFDYKVLTYYHDMTDIVKKEAEAREAEERVKLMLDSTPLICVLLDDLGNIIDCNQEALNIMGVPDKTDFYNNFDGYFKDLQPGGTRSSDMTEENIRVLNEEGSVYFEQTFLTPAGEHIPVESKIARIPWKKTFCYLSFSRDLREIKANEQKMLESEKREREAENKREAAQASNEAKSQFLANMSHEIRTPMNAVLGMSELLLQENLSKRQLRYVSDIKTSAVVLLDIINDILDISKIQAGKFNLVPVHYDFNALIDNISSMAHFLVEDKDIAFKLEMKGDIPKYIFGDDVRLRQVLLNLLSNAVKFTAKGYVILTITATDTIVRFTITDTGIGIRDEDVSRLFDVFEQVDTLTNRGKKGTGLGLSITKGIIEMMGGQIIVESVVGQGTSFHAEIPKVLGDKKLLNNSDNDELSIYAPDAKILVVDDNVINLSVAKGLLRLCKINAETITSGKEAIELIKKNQYDVVFMDYRMPEMSGVETTIAIRELGIDVPIIALTASAIMGAKEMMLDSGMNDFLTKPIIKSELKNILNKWIPANKLLKPPKEKISFNSTENEDDRDSEFWEKIGQIEDISLALGLDRVNGQRDIYKKMLKLVIGDINKSDKNLKEFLAAEDMHNFHIEVHGIKGSLASIGAMEHSLIARDLELASDEADIKYCIANLPSFLNGLNKLNLKIKESFANMNQSDEPVEISPELSHILKRLTEAFVEIDLTRIDKELENLDALDLKGALKEKIEQIKDEAIVMDYDAATAHIAELLDNE
ncbi:MAG: ATP-binding protein [Synergistaceae bacterium]|nr:ATP-binding protein [Synergistaceae bacterium]